MHRCSKPGPKTCRESGISYKDSLSSYYRTTLQGDVNSSGTSAYVVASQTYCRCSVASDLTALAKSLSFLGRGERKKYGKKKENPLNPKK